MFRIFAFCAGFWLLACAALAQENADKDFLTRQLQDLLSGSGRSVDIQGFQGALSSAASFKKMTIADDDGIWLTLEDVELDWNRAALLRGRLDVERLSAARVTVPRLPVASSDTDLPTAEAAPFALPKLPVAIAIKDFIVAEVVLGAPVLGQAVTLEMQATAVLDEALAEVNFLARRSDAKRGDFVVKVNYDRSGGLLDLLTAFSEEADGIVASLLDIPGKPSVIMTVGGTGPIDDYTADLTLATDGEQRLSGQVVVKTQAPRRASNTPDRRITADISGDITTVLLPEYRAFFGPDVGLMLDALVEGNGAVEVSDFSLRAAAVQLAGKVNLNADKWPTMVDIKGGLRQSDGAPVVLPFADGTVSVKQMGLRVLYDAADDDAYTAGFNIINLDTPSVDVARTTLSSFGTLQGNLGSVGQLLGQIKFDTSGLTFVDAANSEAVGQAVTGDLTLNYIEGQPLRLEGLDLKGADYGLTGKAVIRGLAEGFSTRLDMALKAENLSRFSALAGREIAGQTSLALKGTVVPLSGAFEVEAKGQTRDVQIGQAQADALLAGQTDLSVQALRNETGLSLRDLVLVSDALDVSGSAVLASEGSTAQVRGTLKDIALIVPQYQGPVTLEVMASEDAEGWRVQSTSDGPFGVKLSLDGLATGPQAALNFAAVVPEVRAFAPQVVGRVDAKGTLALAEEGWRLAATTMGPYEISAKLEGLIMPLLDLEIDVSAPTLRPLVAQIDGPVRAKGRVRQSDLGFFVDLQADAPGGTTAKVEGLATGPDMSLTFDVATARVAKFAPGVPGSAKARGVLRQTPQGITIDVNGTGPYASSANVQGRVTGQSPSLNFAASMANIGALVEKVTGPLKVSGNATQQSNGWALRTNVSGPSGTQALVEGMIESAGSVDLSINGTAPLGLASPFIAPRNLQGQARFGLTLRGKPGLDALSGRISAQNATFSAPNLRVALQNISADVQLVQGRANLAVSGNAVQGGQVNVRGEVALSGAIPANLAIGLQNVNFSDPRLYQSSLTGQLQVSGPLTGGAQISGELGLGETQVRVPSTGLTSIGEIPAITHVGASGAVRVTQRKAGISGVTASNQGSVQSGGPAYGLNIRIRAPSRIFVRGRGLDAELGGGLVITGSTARVISAGQFDLLRGRLDILGKRFDLEEGAIQFQGDLVPYIRFVSSTNTQNGLVRVIVEGRADAPEVVFESTPAAPQDEVLAQFLFGRQIDEISAFQALQLANAVAVLAGKGGGGVVGKLRDKFDLDDLDLTTTDEGATAVRAGKYIADNVYTDVTAASDGSAEVSLNIDLNANLKAKGTFRSDGNSSIGLFFEKDY